MWRGVALGWGGGGVEGLMGAMRLVCDEMISIDGPPMFNMT